MQNDENIFAKLQELNCKIKIDVVEETWTTLKETFPCTSEEDLKDLSQRLKRGDLWAFCTVLVSVISPNGFEGIQTLGCCSYKNMQDFIENSGYYEDMVKEAFENLCTNLRIRMEEADRMLRDTEREYRLLDGSFY